MPRRAACAIAALLVAGVSGIQAQRLPFKTYSTGDGLAHFVVNRIIRDSRGFLWFCTRQGLSRFDGHEFVNFGTDQGLPGPAVNDLVQLPNGSYWIATSAGLVRFDPHGRPLDRPYATGQDARPPMFTTYKPAAEATASSIGGIALDPSGDLWVGTAAGLFRTHLDGSSTPIDLHIPNRLQARAIGGLLVDRSGTLWAGANGQLYRRRPDGQIDAFTEADGVPTGTIDRILEDREGRIWLATRSGGLREFRLAGIERQPRLTRVIDEHNGLPGPWVTDVLQDSTGRFWAATPRGLMTFDAEADSPSRVHVIAEPEGLPGASADALAEDADGNLWMGIEGVGAAKLSNRGLTTFAFAQPRTSPNALLESSDGQLIVTVGVDGRWSAMRFDGQTFASIPRARLPGHATWGWDQMSLQDSRGDWWFGLEEGVVRYASIAGLEQLAASRPDLQFTRRDGLSANIVIRLFEDPRGDIWIGTVGHGVTPNGLSLWRRHNRTLINFSEADGLPGFDRFYPSSFAADRGGQVWIGFSGSAGLVRYAAGGFTRFTEADGVPPRQIRNLALDSGGRVWGASYGAGLLRIDEPASPHPRFRTYTTADGLSSNETDAVVEGSPGELYVGTAAGIDRMEISANRIARHYTVADGVPASGEMCAAIKDHAGTLWFAYANSVVRLIRDADRPVTFAPVVISAIQVDGRDYPMSVLGEEAVAGVRVVSDGGTLRIAFDTAWYGSPKDLKYQYRLDGVDRDWSAPTDLHAVNYAGLSPGTRRFQVRAVNADGQTSPRVATVSLTVVPPFWRAAWFIAVVIGLAAAAAYAAHRRRVARVLELAEIRTRIATDLHDDIGTDLSRVAILSEVVRRTSAGGDGDSHLGSIARIARESIATMSDIVWAINPERDSVMDLVRKMRDQAEEATDGAGIELAFNAPADVASLPLEMDVRRDLFLIFKEAVGNAVEHARCRRLSVTLTVSGRRLHLQIEDDGIGFDPAHARDGNGLINIARRADRLGAALTVQSWPQQGTRIRVDVELRSKRRGRALPQQVGSLDA
jgi:ligand-binding sensor domain-containing protein/signal transduction histidine kinase